MKQFFLLFSLFAVGFSMVDVQREVVRIEWKEYRQNNQSGDQFMLTFEGAEFPDPVQDIPHYVRTTLCNDNDRMFRYVMEDPFYERADPVPEKWTELELEQETNPVNQLTGSGKQLISRLVINPVVRRDDGIWLLKSFTLKKIPAGTVKSNTAPFLWKSSSVLKSGKWLKIKTSGRGIYKIPFSVLTEWGFSNPSNVGVYGSGGTILPENPGDIPYDDLEECAIWHGSNNGQECLFFYEPGLVKWNNDSGVFFRHNTHSYSTRGTFFLTEGRGNAKLVTKLQPVQEPSTHQITDFSEMDLYEKDELNLIRSGKKWFGEKFNNGSSRNIDIPLKDVSGNQVNVKINAAGRSYDASALIVQTGQKILGRIDFFKVNTSDNTSLYADERNAEFLVSPSGSTLSLGILYQATNNNAQAWLDFIELNYRRNLRITGGFMFFRDPVSVGNGNVLEFILEGGNSSTRVFDVTEVSQISEIPLQLSGSKVTGKRPADKLREYVAFDPSGLFPVPELAGEVDNQDLHGLDTPDLLIISHPLFINEASRLAGFHRNYDGMKVEVVTTEKVYNEFSSGNPDATGIRNFIKMFYDRDENLKYVLLFGDGSYDNRNIKAGNQNFIPAFQSDNSLNPVASFVTDDYYVILDDNETVYNGAVDLGIGRIPASSVYQAEIAVSKILDYHDPESLGDWRNIICFIGDDGDGNLHMSDSEKLAGQVNESHPEFVTDKIYFDAFVQKTTPSGEEYPDVTEAINTRVEEGVLVLNYVGHANERFLADEHVLDISDINSWSNSKKLPVFVTATCEFSRFDGDETSAGEYVLFNATGGGIGLFSTTRVVFAYSNYLLSKSFYSFVFQKDTQGEHYRMGDVMRLAKINTINTTNKRNFSLLADPALRLSYPQYKVVTSSINQKNVTENPDTLGALMEVAVTGYIADHTGKKLDGFSGEIIPTVFDKAAMMKTLGNAGETPMEFKLQENVIYKGLASVTNGNFSFRFIIPKDISYTIGQGKIIYYANDGTDDAHGAFRDFIIGGKGSQIVDNKGPDIELFMDTPDFASGDKTSKNPTLLAYLSDENGINTVGSGIGHDITAILDNDYSQVFVLNQHYQANIDDNTSGIVRFPMKDLSPGKHLLRIKAWDVANNSSESEIEFMVTGEFEITGVSCYPNPVTDYTYFTFAHNQAGARMETIIEIFDQNGRRIDMIETETGSGGTVSNPVRWNPEDTEIPVRSGLYVYRIVARNKEGLIASGAGKMLISR